MSIEAAARAMLAFERGGNACAADLLDAMAADDREWCRLAREVMDRATEMRGGRLVPGMRSDRRRLRRRVVTPELRREMVRLVCGGERTADVALRYGVALSTVYNALHTYGVRARRRKAA